MAIAILQNAGAGKPGQVRRFEITENGTTYLTPEPGCSLDGAIVEVKTPERRQGTTLELNIMDNMEETYTPDDEETVYTAVKIKVAVPQTVGDTSVTAAMIDGTAMQVKIPDNVKKIRSCAFAKCNNLKCIIIPDSVTEIGTDAFKNCEALEEVHISDMAAWCEVLLGNEHANPAYQAKSIYLKSELVTDLTIPEVVTAVGDYVFVNNQALTTVTFPSRIKTIGAQAFSECNSIKTYDFTACKDVPDLGDAALMINEGTKIIVPYALYGEWITATNWAKYKDYIVTSKSKPDQSKFNIYVDANTLHKIVNFEFLGQRAGVGVGKNEVLYDYNVPFLRIYGDGSSDEAWAIVPNIEDKTSGKYLVFAYRLPTTNTETYTNIQVFATTGGADITGQGDMFYMTAEKDGKWHVGVIDIEEAIKSSPWVANGSNSCKFNPNSDGTYTISRLRLDWFNKKTSVDSYIDVAYVGICDTLEKAIRADPDYTGREFGAEYFANALGSSAVLKSHDGMEYVSISDVVPSNGEVRHYLYDGGEAMLLGASHYIGVLYRDAPEQYCEFHANSSNNLTDSRWYSTQYIMYEQGSDWKFMIFSLPKLADTVCRKLRLDYFNKLTAGDTKSIDVAFVKFFANTDEANEYYQKYIKKYKLNKEETT